MAQPLSRAAFLPVTQQQRHTMQWQETSVSRSNDRDRFGKPPIGAPVPAKPIEATKVKRPKPLLLHDVAVRRDFHPASCRMW
ncbi:hypothetical protein EBE87_16860 [Pseudoroseomonas wenyumeiae]|uniref:Uncharacterized protein n=1 Tax=Teichococcus wenyumeiae TaxID=2478470 RepID=A0A3A9J6F1_9PROT|nr:hypothetical protein [Pseudoroseomonas wenyumeiae]RKK02022.1 hypothetical protein D6Z83_21955 [Pseudoroseomonas wenyumeiae]RMI20152.1 hypothetical protein EBE87_16860 [Pseudoroseomonas wenyumeiae]